LAEKEFTTEDAAHILTATYGIGHEQAMKDAQVWVDALMKCKVIE
jgi:2-polyprenyl-6-methoxyphenol hydroxylase-like FAD-dependent oxidoreductase